MSSRAGALACLAQSALHHDTLLEYTPGESLIVARPWPGDRVSVLGRDGKPHVFEVALYRSEQDASVKAFAYLVDVNA